MKVKQITALIYVFFALTSGFLSAGLLKYTTYSNIAVAEELNIQSMEVEVTITDIGATMKEFIFYTDKGRFKSINLHNVSIGNKYKIIYGTSNRWIVSIEEAE